MLTGHLFFYLFICTYWSWFILRFVCKYLYLKCWGGVNSVNFVVENAVWWTCVKGLKTGAFFLVHQFLQVSFEEKHKSREQVGAL